MVAPSANPIAASFAVNHAASRSTEISSGPCTREGSPSAVKIGWTCGSVVSFTGNGHVQPAEIQTQR